jgi:glycine dehydrogenase
MSHTNELNNTELLRPVDSFVKRHIGPRTEEVSRMLAALGVVSLDELIDQAVPQVIRMAKKLELRPPRSESEVLTELRELADDNLAYRSFIGMGYSDCLIPPVIQRNILENPGWYTQYTPYQPEIAQGRLEALLNFQTMITDLTGMDIANASLLDEGTAAAEAMTLCQRSLPRKSTANTFFVSERCHPHVIAVVETRAEPLGINVVVGDHTAYKVNDDTFGVLVQYPATDGDILDYGPFFEQTHEAGAFTVVAADLLALTLLRAPGEFGADIVVGNSQRFGVPLGYGVRDAGFLATIEVLKREMPVRLVVVSVYSCG